MESKVFNFPFSNLFENKLLVSHFSLELGLSCSMMGYTVRRTAPEHVNTHMLLAKARNVEILQYWPFGAESWCVWDTPFVFKQLASLLATTVLSVNIATLDISRLSGFASSIWGAIWITKMTKIRPVRDSASVNPDSAVSSSSSKVRSPYWNRNLLGASSVHFWRCKPFSAMSSVRDAS